MNMVSARPANGRLPHALYEDFMKFLFLKMPPWKTSASRLWPRRAKMLRRGG